MIIWTYKLKKDLFGRVASQFNWELSSVEHQVFLHIHDGRIINAKSLIGLLSGRFVKGDIIEIATYTQEEQRKIGEVIQKLELATRIE